MTFATYTESVASILRTQGRDYAADLLTAWGSERFATLDAYANGQSPEWAADRIARGQLGAP